jgi:hypothetical protein
MPAREAGQEKTEEITLINDQTRFDPAIGAAWRLRAASAARNAACAQDDALMLRERAEGRKVTGAERKALKTAYKARPRPRL